ncbi:MAG TPA: trehalose-6-phosphate synthase [Tepidiformaceae bacterium]|nr:trehalose-6-phosphate synthase [Tepidiformaceae bacterium]
MDPRADLVLANRAYCDHDLPPGEGPAVSPGHGGLLAALRSAIVPWDGRSGTTWIGSGRGSCDRQYTDEHGYELIDTARGALRHQRLYFDEDTWRGHYSETANSFLWPLLHLVREPLPRVADYYPHPHTPPLAAWHSYERVNSAFARAAVENHPARSCWVHDYQLALAPALLRERALAVPIGFFLHTPFPDIHVASHFLDPTGRDYLRQFVAGLLGSDLVGFQSAPDRERFHSAALELGLAEVAGEEMFVQGRRMRTGVYPVGVDLEEVVEAARTARLPAGVTEAASSGLPLVIGLERADFTKGIPERLEAVARLWREGVPFAYVGAAAPTRDGVPAYDELGPAISRAAAGCTEAAKSAGGRFLFFEEAMSWEEVVALQREADVVFTSSLADGMNLVPLQAAVAQSLRPGSRRAVIITGRDAGVAHTFAGYEEDGLVAVDPLDAEAMALTLRAALAGQPGRVSDRLIASVRGNDARNWAARFLSDLEGAHAHARSH